MSKMAHMEALRNGYLVPDLLAPQLKLVFCGTAPSEASARKRAYYANPGNQFWPVLARVGLTPVQFRPSQYRELLSLSIGLTDLCKTHWGNDDDLPADGFNPEKLWHKIVRYQPRLVAFTSKTAGSHFLNRKVDYGMQRESLGMTQFFVAPSTSGRARRFWREDVWQDLARLIRELR